MSRKRICIIYTGGTLGMRPSRKGYAPAGDLLSLIRDRLPELSEPSMPHCELVEYSEPLESSNATPHHWYELAGRIRASANRFDGFVVIHGTDTLAYTASALSFLLTQNGKPVLVTGSQIPLCEVRNDAQGNLVSAVQAAASGEVKEVAVCFGRYILRGNRATKVRATELDAFGSPNWPALAEIGTEIRFSGPSDAPWEPSALCEREPDFRDSTIAVLRIFPGMSDRLIDAIVDAGARGIILRCYGVGTAPSENPAFIAALRRACEAGVVVIAVSQCLEGSVSLARYAAGALLSDIGVVSGTDMTTEAAFTKLHALFALDLDRETVAALMTSNLRGELTPATASRSENQH